MATEPGWYWGYPETRWDVFPQAPKLERVLVKRDGPFVSIHHAGGAKVRVGYILDRPLTKEELESAR